MKYYLKENPKSLPVDIKIRKEKKRDGCFQIKTYLITLCLYVTMMKQLAYVN